jgi:transcriptional regulator with GAF, ATPase, and Fis domain
MPDPNLHSTLGSLSSALLTEDANLQAALRRIAQAGSELMPKCAGASVTIIETGQPSTVAATNETALMLDESQYEVDDGPCLSAARTKQIIRIDDAAAERRWPNFTTTAGDVGVWSSLSMPLQFADESYRGCLNLYGLEPMAFSETDEQVANAFADQASVVVANARAYWAAFEMTKNLTIAMESRGVIDQAKGILMERHHVDADTAFGMLRQRSQAENRKLRDIASEVVAGTTRSDT